MMLCGVASARDVDAEKDLLLSGGIKSDPDALHQFFDSMNPEGDVVAFTKRLLSQLGEDDFAKREQATTSLLMLPQVPMTLLQEAAKSGDPEIRWRSKLVLSQAGGRSKRLLRAALRIIAQDEMKGFGRDIIACEHHFNNTTLQRLAQQAMVATVEESDRDLLQESSKHRDAQIRILAVRGLVTALGRQAADEIRPLLKDSNDQVRVYAAAELSNQGEREALLTLADLLHSTDLNVRSKSVQLLRRFTDQDFKYTAYGSRSSRLKAAKAWRGWLSKDSSSAHFKADIAIDQLRVGRILVCYYNTNRVVEYDESHEVVWEISLPQPWGCQGLPNGHRLITSFQSNVVIEYDASGKEVWRASVGNNPSYAQRLENGNTLVALYSQNKVIEITPDSEVVNTIPTHGPVAFAERTEDGHTLVAIAGKGDAIEYNEKGHKIKTYSSQRAFSARRLSNGNVLIADSSAGAARELDEKQKVIWSKSYPNPLDAFRLDNGNTLVAHQNGLSEVDSDGDEVWSDTGKGQAIRISYY